MEQETKKKQSDILRSKASAIDTAAGAISLLIVLFVIGSILRINAAMQGSAPMLFIIIAAICGGASVYLTVTFFSATSEFFKTQSDILDALNDIRNSKKETNSDADIPQD